MSEGISDKSIMDATVVEHQESSGRIRFKTTLPSGKPLESEWLQESIKTRGMLQWVAAVKQAIKADEAEEEQARKERVAASKKQKKATLAAASGDALSAALGFPPISQSSPDGIESSTPAAPSLVSDPFAFLEQSLKAAEKAAMSARVNLAHAQAQSEAAEASYKRWRQAYDAIHTAHKIEAVPSPE